MAELVLPIGKSAFIDQFSFCARMNCSLATDNTIRVLDNSVELSKAGQLDFVRGFIDSIEERPNAQKKLENTVQWINGIPLIGTITSLITTIAYLIARTVSAYRTNSLINDIIPSDPVKSQRLAQFILNGLGEGLDPQKDINFSKQILEIILDKKFDDLAHCTEEDQQRFLELIGSENVESVLVEFQNKLSTQIESIMENHHRTLWYTNQTVRSAIGIIPLFKPIIRTTQEIQRLIE